MYAQGGNAMKPEGRGQPVQRKRKLRPPVTLTVHDLLTPVEKAHAGLEKIARAQVHAHEVATGTKDLNLSAVMNQGMFVLAFSTMEVMIQEVIAYVLRHFPEKMGETQLKTKEVIGTILTSDLLEEKAQGVVRALMYNDIETILEKFGDYTGIVQSYFCPDQVQRLAEFKSNRNEILHGGNQQIDSAVLAACLDTIKYFIGEIDTKLRHKYASYTRVKALQELWNFMFFDPRFAPFDDFWEADAEHDVVRMKDNKEAEARLSDSEQVFLAIWRNVLVGSGAPPLARSFSFLLLDSRSRRKVAVFLACSADLGVLVNR